MLLPVAEYLIAQGHLNDADWHKDLAKFVEAGINKLITATEIQKHKTDAPSLSAKLADHQGFYSRTDELGKKLLLGIEGGDCGYFRMGAVTRKLERTAKGLGAAFYAAVVDSLGEVGWVFDFSYAEYDRDSQQEMACDEIGKGWDELTDDEKGQYEILNPDADLPKYLEPVKHGGITAARRDLLKAYRARHPKLINLALQMCDHAAKLHGYGKEHPEGDSPCAYLVHIEDYDAITASFDEWSQHFLGGDVTYLWARTFDPASPTELRKAFEAFESAVLVLRTAAELAPLVNGVKK